jgi:hypothetical protein
VLRRTTDKLGLIRLTTAWTWGSHHFPPYKIFCVFTWGPHPNGILSQDSQMGVLEFPQLGLSQLWRPITLRENLRLWWSLKQSSSPCWELFNGILHATCTLGNRVNSQLLMVGSQTTNLIPILSFDHDLCFRCPNGSCKFISDIYVLIAFQWYKKLFEPMGFDSYNYTLKIWEPIWDWIPTMGVHLGVWGFIPSHSLHSREHVMWLPGFPFGPQPCKPLPWSRAQG